MAEEKLRIEKELEVIKEEIEDLKTKLVTKIHQRREANARYRELFFGSEYDRRKYTTPRVNDLTNDEIYRYCRQLILPGFGVPAQSKLIKTSFLIVGVGGLGCPAAQYLVGAGSIRLGLVDYDIVDRSNLHRQTLYTEESVGIAKVTAAKDTLEKINTDLKVEARKVTLNSSNALEIINQYDVILDCTDNVVTRYLLNDACILANKPLVSGSALQFDGQITVYNYGATCPCYRCLFPVPPPPTAVTNCGDGGVLGAVPGIIGCMQALEAIKVATGVGETLAGRLLIFDGLTNTFRNIKLRGRRSDCKVCSNKPLITELIDYEQYCGMRATDEHESVALIPMTKRLDVVAYIDIQSKPHLLIDVRTANEFEMCRLPMAINMPLKEILENKFLERFPKEIADKTLPIILYCRRGNDSQIAVQHMSRKCPQNSIFDIAHGLIAYHRKIDKDFPIY